MAERTIIGLTGGMCSGKDSWAEFLQEQFGYKHASTSAIVRRYINEHDLGEPTRDLTRETATYLRTLHGADYLIREAILETSDSERVVVSGLYVTPEVRYLQKFGGTLITIVANDQLRFDRMSARSRSGEQPVMSEFRRLMDNDLKSEETDQNLSDVIDMASIRIDGAISLEDTDRCKKIASKVLSLISPERNQ